MRDHVIFSESDVNVQGFNTEEEMSTITELGIKDGDQLLAEDRKEKG